jgi:hypothetical protein
MSQRAVIATFTTQNVYYYSASWGGSLPPVLINGGNAMSAGSTITMTPSVVNLDSFGAGDFVCGTSGGITVGGQGDSQDRDWVPARVNGTGFTLPLTRNQPHIIYVSALNVASVATLYYGLVVQTSLELAPFQVRHDCNLSMNAHNHQPPTTTTTNHQSPTTNRLNQKPQTTNTINHHC